MEPMTMALLAGAGTNILGGILGGNAASKAAAQAAAAQKEMYDKNVALLESVGVPTIEAQEIALQSPEYVGDYVAQIQGDTELKEIATDPQLRRNQMEALAQVKELSEQGLGTVDKIAIDEANLEATQADKARRAQILSQMAQRGTADSGVQLAMQLASAQDAATQAQTAANNQAKMAASNRMNAINQLAQQSANMENLDFNRQAQIASAQDAIQRFNAQTMNQQNQYNLQNRQNIANQQAETANKQQMYNKGLIQQDYLNRLNKATAQTGQNTAYGSNLANNALTAGQGKANMYSSIGQGLGNMATAFAANSAQKPQKSTTGSQGDLFYMNEVE